MKSFMSLLKTNLNVHFGISALKYRYFKEKKRLWEPVLIAFAVIVGGGSLVLLYSLLLLGVFMGGQVLGQPEIVLTFAFMATQLLILVFGIFYIMSAFYFSNDMTILIPLPLKPSEVLGVKFMTILISEYLIALPALLPAFIIYGTGTGANIFYWIKGLILVLTSPILPLVIAAIFVILLMRFVNIRKSKDVMVVIGSLLGLFLGLGVNFLAQKMPEGNEEEFIKNLIESNTGLIESIGNKFPPSIWATLGLSSPGWQGFAYFLLFIGLSLVLFAALLWLGNRFFYQGYISGQDVQRKGKSLSRKALRNANKVSGPVQALFRREWKLFFRTPIYVMNGLAGMIMVPFFMVMPLVTQSEELTEVLNYARDPEYAMITTLICLGIMTFATSINTIASTSLSREGQTFWISKMIPVSPRNQVLAKLLHCNSLSLVGLIIIAIPLYFLLDLSLYRLLIMVIIGLLANILVNNLGLMIDVFRPKLEWNDPQEAIKQNFNAFLAIVLAMLAMFALGIVTFILAMLDLPELLIYGVLTLIIILLSVLSLWGLVAVADRKYRELEI